MDAASPPSNERRTPERALAEAQAAVAAAAEETKRAAERYFGSPLKASVESREAYYEALRRQWEAERDYYDMKRRLARATRETPSEPRIRRL